MTFSFKSRSSLSANCVFSLPFIFFASFSNQFMGYSSKYETIAFVGIKWPWWDVRSWQIILLEDENSNKLICMHILPCWVFLLLPGSIPPNVTKICIHILICLIWLHSWFWICSIVIFAGLKVLWILDGFSCFTW